MQVTEFAIKQLKFEIFSHSVLSSDSHLNVAQVSLYLCCLPNIEQGYDTRTALGWKS